MLSNEVSPSHARLEAPLSKRLRDLMIIIIYVDEIVEAEGYILNLQIPEKTQNGKL